MPSTAIDSAIFSNMKLPEVANYVDRKELSKLCDPVNYLGLSAVKVDRVLAGLRV